MRALPTFEYKGRTYYVDARLSEIRDVDTAEPTQFDDLEPAQLQALITELHGKGELTDFLKRL